MSHKLPELPYSYDALEPFIDATTMELHHQKHHAGYVAKLNEALESSPNLRDRPLSELLSDLNSIPSSIRTTVRNNGGGHFNHSLFWTTLKKSSEGGPSGELGDVLKSSFGSFRDFRQQFTEAAVTLFGSGWVWLCVQNGRVFIESTPNQDSPVMTGNIPILGLDVWEHAYYLKYQNRRPDYIEAWWNIINWDQIARNYADAGAMERNLVGGRKHS